MRSPFALVAATQDEVSAQLVGDDVIADPDVVMDRAFTVGAVPDVVWPWLVQLGKRRAGWYLPRSVERFVPPSRRGLRVIDPAWQRLGVGDVIPDYGGAAASFEAVVVEPPTALVYWSRRGRTEMSWAIALSPDAGATGSTRVLLRLRLAPVRHTWLANTVGDLFDLITVAGMAAGLRERVAATKPTESTGHRAASGVR